MDTYFLPSSLDKDINRLEGQIEEYKRGNISSAQIKAYRVPFGIYEQREHGTYMVRIRCAAGIITPYQLVKVSELSSQAAGEKIHLTSRQELQIHYVKLDDVIKILRALKEIGLASKGGGGNTVRNIIVPESSGISLDEVFDVSPHAVALTSRLIAEEDSWTLPRKLKIAFSGSSKDKGYATISDIGFIARIKDDKKGFRVYAAGGMGAKSLVGNLFFDFVREEEVYNITKAIKNLFWKYGNRKNKHAARLRFLYASLGEQGFREKFEQEYDLVKKKNYPPLTIEETNNIAVEPDIKKKELSNINDFQLWKKRFARPQKQKDLYSVIIPIELGFIDNKKAKSLAKFLGLFGDNTIRLAKNQNFLIRNIKDEYLTSLYSFLKDTLDNFNRPLICDSLLSCAGASTCQLGICLSRGAARVAIKELEKSGLDLDSLSNLKINISGCPNSCGHHYAADLGFFGKADRINGKLYPAYNVAAGAAIKDPEPEFAKLVNQISAKALPKLVVDLLREYLSKKGYYKSFQEYIKRDGKGDMSKICGKYEDIYSFKDWGEKEDFSLSGRGTGECAASLADLTEQELEKIGSSESGERVVDKVSGKVIKDLRGVACPMNFVKTKIELAKLNPKEILEVWLDDGEPIENVPGSVREEGHNILEQKKTNDYWVVVIEKK